MPLNYRAQVRSLHGFKNGDNEIQWIPSNRILVKEDILGVVSLAESGLGICQSYSFIVNEKNRQEKLQPLLEGYAGHTRPFYCTHNINICRLRQEL